VKEFKRITPVFAYHLLSGMHLEQYNGGAAVPTLNRNDVHQVDVLLPPERLINDFTDYALPIYEQTKLLNLSNEKLQQARDLLLPRLMNGEIPV
jgi:type I restriction enzyme S subunit